MKLYTKQLAKKDYNFDKMLYTKKLYKKLKSNFHFSYLNTKSSTKQDVCKLEEYHGIVRRDNFKME